MGGGGRVEDVERSTSARSAATPGFEEYVVARWPTLWRVAWLLTGDVHRAEDLVQAALLKCWPHWGRIASDGAVDGYVRRALMTTYTDWRRRRWVGELPTAVVPDLLLAERPAVDQRRDVLAALATLPRGQRAVVVLRFYEDLTEAATAHALGVSVGTVKSQTARALAALRASPILREDQT